MIISIWRGDSDLQRIKPLDGVPSLAASPGTAEPVRPRRIYFMDAMRSVLMMLGVVLHSAQIYNPEKSWLFHARESSVIAGYVVDAIHIFRMPTFFVVAGFFCAFSLARWSPRRFLEIRLVRIGVPLLFAGLVLNSVQTIVLATSGWMAFDVDAYALQGGWISHLWFLIDLIVLFVIAAVVATYFRNCAAAVSSYLVAWLKKIPVTAVIFLMPLVTIATLAAGRVGFPLYASVGGVLNVYSIARYSLFFLVGALMYANHGFMRDFSRISPAVCAISIASAAVIQMAVEREGILATVTAEYCRGVVVWASIALCFFVFQRLFDSPSRHWLFLSEASYTVYLTHHLLVVLLGLLLIDSGPSPMVIVGILAIFVFSITLTFHLLVIRRFSWARLLVNGR